MPARLQVALQIPELQTGVPPVTAGQTRPHMPQLLVVSSAVSQPFGRLLSQSPKPVLQLGTHTEFAQLVVPCPLVQAMPQPPQFAVLVRVLTSQPFGTALSQLA